MFTGDEDVQATALRAHGWSISGIARHLGRDRKTVRDHLSCKRSPGVRLRSEPDPLETFVAYLVQRFNDDPHVWATARTWSVSLRVSCRERPGDGAKGHDQVYRYVEENDDCCNRDKEAEDDRGAIGDQDEWELATGVPHVRVVPCVGARQPRTPSSSKRAERSFAAM